MIFLAVPGPRPFIGRYHLIPQGIHFTVYRLEFRVSLEPRQRSSYPLCPVHFAKVIGNKALDLAVIEYYTVGLITDQASGCMRPVGCNEI
jgi:hypothetical protein